MDWFDLIATFGKRYLRWVLNVPLDEELPDEPTMPQKTVISFLTVAANRPNMITDGRPTAYFSFDVEQQAFQFMNPGAFVPFSDALRESCGGSRAALEQEVGSSFVRALLDLGNDAYARALYALRDGNSLVGFDGSGVIRPWWSNPSRAVAVAELESDQVYKELFSVPPIPGQEAIGPSTAMLVTNTGRGSSLQRIGYPDHILEQAAVLARIRSPSFTESEFARAIVDTAHKWRMIAAGAEVNLPVLTAFAGPNLQVPIQTSWGTLLPYGREYDAFDPGFGGPFSGISSAQDVGRLGFVLLWDQPFKLLPGDFMDSGNRDVHAELSQTFQDLVTRTSSLLTIASIDRGELSASSLLWSVGLNPFAAGLNASGSRSARPFSSMMSFGTEDTESLDKAQNVLRAGWPDPAVRVALRRAQLAITERDDPKDALIDAVIGWEAAFGRGGSQELSFRITASMAFLLADTGADRLAAQVNLKKLYGLRSKVVHGEEHSLKSEMYETSRSATVFLIESIVRLYEKRPDLFGAKDLATRLLLDVRPEVATPTPEPHT